MNPPPRGEPAAAQEYFKKGLALREAGKPVEAMEAFKRAHELNPGDPDVLFAAAETLHYQWYLIPAISGYRRALRMRPDVPRYLNGLATALFENGQGEEAIIHQREAIAISPDDAALHWNLSCFLLSMGDFPEGLSEFEWRLRIARLGLNRGFSQPQWNGEDLTGKTILLHAEGGHGDSIHYVRYVPMMKDRGAKIILECQPALITLFEQVHGVSQLIPRGQPLPEFDFHCPLIGLPRIFGTTLRTIPAEVPYLNAPADRIEKFRRRIPPDGKLKVGLVWAG
jgi:tetratricopeptide (TPR) repeat protein